MLCTHDCCRVPTPSHKIWQTDILEESNKSRRAQLWTSSPWGMIIRQLVFQGKLSSTYGKTRATKTMWKTNDLLQGIPFYLFSCHLPRGTRTRTIAQVCLPKNLVRTKGIDLLSQRKAWLIILWMNSLHLSNRIQMEVPFHLRRSVT